MFFPGNRPGSGPSDPSTALFMMAAMNGNGNNGVADDVLEAQVLAQAGIPAPLATMVAFQDAPQGGSATAVQLLTMQQLSQEQEQQRRREEQQRHQSYATPQQGYQMPPQPGYAMPPQPGYAMPPQPGYAMPPQPGYAMPPQPGYAMPPQPGYAMPPQQAYAMPPQQNYAAAPAQPVYLPTYPGYGPAAAQTPASNSRHRRRPSQAPADYNDGDDHRDEEGNRGASSRRSNRHNRQPHRCNQGDSQRDASYSGSGSGSDNDEEPRNQRTAPANRS